MSKVVFLVLFFGFFTSVLKAHQPVMDMAPRWKGGYGFQLRYEMDNREKLLKGKDSIENPLGLKSDTSTLWLEGVYTFTRETRLSLKIPYISNTQTVATSLTETRDITTRGLGDVILASINKWYFNIPHLTGNFSITPQVKTPTGKSIGGIDLGAKALDLGLSVSASVESYRFYGMWDFFSWMRAKRGAVVGFDFDWGYHPYHHMKKNIGIFTMLGTNGRYFFDGPNPGEEGGQTAEIVPTLVWYKGNLMVRGQYHIPVFANLKGTQLAPAPRFQFGAGAAF